MVTPTLKSKQNQTIKNPKGNHIPSLKRLFTLKESAEYLGRSEWSMRELIWAGEIPVVRAEGGRKVFLDIQDLDNFINRHKSVYK